MGIKRKSFEPRFENCHRWAFENCLVIVDNTSDNNEWHWREQDQIYCQTKTATCYVFLVVFQCWSKTSVTDHVAVTWEAEKLQHSIVAAEFTEWLDKKSSYIAAIMIDFVVLSPFSRSYRTHTASKRKLLVLSQITPIGGCQILGWGLILVSVLN